MSARTVEERLASLEDRFDALCPERRTEFWVIQSEGETLAYWGPCRTPEEARNSSVFRPEYGCVVIEIPRTGEGRLPSARESSEPFQTLRPIPESGRSAA